MTVAVKSPVDVHHKPVIDEVMARARAAFEAFRDASQERTDEAVRALAWSVYKPEHARELAALAVADTGLGNVPDKIIKNQRKTFGTLRDLLRAKSVGIIEEDKTKGIVKYAKPMGVVAALTPSTNPAATPVNKAMMAIKGRNAVVIAPSPLGYETTKRTVDYMRAALAQVGLPADLVQVLPPPVTKELTEALMKAADLVVVTGSQDNVRRAAMSGTPAIGVGVGNVPVIIDETADLADAARKIRDSKIFDNSTSCSSENSVIILDTVYDKAIAALQTVGGYLCTAPEKAAVAQALWHHGKLNRHLIARDSGDSGAGLRVAGGSRARRLLHGRGLRCRQGASVLGREARRSFSPSIASRILPRPKNRSAPCSTIRAGAIPAASIPRTWRMRASWLKISTWCGCW